MKKFYNSKTLIFALLTEIFGVLEAFEWSNFLESKKAGIVIMGLAVVSAGLRFATSKSIGGGGIETGKDG